MLVVSGCSKNLNNLFYKTPMDAPGWIKKDNIEKLVIVALVSNNWAQEL